MTKLCPAIWLESPGVQRHQFLFRWCFYPQLAVIDVCPSTGKHSGFFWSAKVPRHLQSYRSQVALPTFARSWSHLCICRAAAVLYPYGHDIVCPAQMHGRVQLSKIVDSLQVWKRKGQFIRPLIILFFGASLLQLDPHQIKSNQTNYMKQ